MKKFSSVFILLSLFRFLTAQVAIDISEENAWIKKPFPISENKFTFAILGDKTTGDARNWPIFDRAVDEINQLRPDFVIMPGDLIQGYVTNKDIVINMWKEFREHASRLQVPFYVLPGNHDISNEMMYDYWTENIGLRYYSFVYNNNLFLLLNTEEYRKTNDGVLGSLQLSFIEKQIAKNKNVDQIFLFIHRPQWGTNGLKENGSEEWPMVLSWLKNKNVTVFAAHWHNLYYQEIEKIPHINISATGGRLTPKTLPDLGFFHHYTLVTVDGDSSYFSIIKPGSVFDEKIANAGFIKKASSLVEWNDEVSVDISSRHLKACVDFKIENKLNKPIDISFAVISPSESKWQFDNNQESRTLEPGITGRVSFSGESTIDFGVPFPSLEYSVKLDGDMVDTNTIFFFPEDSSLWRSPKEVLISDAIGLGMKNKAHTKEELVPILKNAFNLEDDLSWYINNNGSSEWQNTQINNAKIDFDALYEDKDFSAAFVKFTIQSPEKIEVLTALRPDNYCKVYLNGETVFDGLPLKGVPDTPYLFLLPLQKGNNEIVLKTADYYGNWYSLFKVIDPLKKLTFKLPRK